MNLNNSVLFAVSVLGAVLSFVGAIVDDVSSPSAYAENHNANLRGVESSQDRRELLNPKNDRYIVQLDPKTSNVAKVAKDLSAASKGKPGINFKHAIKGFVFVGNAKAAEALKKNPKVVSVEQDSIQIAAAQTIPTGIKRIFAHDGNTDPTCGSCANMKVAVIDTGVDLSHPDLNVNADLARDCTGGSCTPGGDDGNGHGTHVAGTIGAIDNSIGVVGVCPGAEIVPVKVLDSNGSGYTSWIIAGIDYIASLVGDNKVHVANMSLGGSGCVLNGSYRQAVANAIAGGTAVVVAAGNSGADARNYQPACFPEPLTVSALADFDGLPGGSGSQTCRNGVDDTLADFSNWGPAVDIMAPGVCITSTVPGGGYEAYSGTSMASPHVAGALAIVASNPSAYGDTPQDWYKAVVDNGNLNWDANNDRDNEKEVLLDVSGLAANAVGCDGSPPMVSINAPTDGTTYTVEDMPVTFFGSAFDAEDGDLSSFISWSSDLDGPLGSGGSTSSTLRQGTHTITAEVTDSGGRTATSAIAIAIQGSGGTDIQLTVVTYKVKGVKRADVSWSGSLADMGVKIDGVLIATVKNTSSYTHNTGRRGWVTVSYQVCEAVTNTCSNEVIASW